MARIQFDRFLGGYLMTYRGKQYALTAATFYEATAETKAIIKNEGA